MFHLTAWEHCSKSCSRFALPTKHKAHVPAGAADLFFIAVPADFALRHRIDSSELKKLYIRVKMPAALLSSSPLSRHTQPFTSCPVRMPVRYHARHAEQSQCAKRISNENPSSPACQVKPQFCSHRRTCRYTPWRCMADLCPCAGFTKSRRPQPKRSYHIYHISDGCRASKQCGAPPCSCCRHQHGMHACTFTNAILDLWYDISSALGCSCITCISLLLSAWQFSLCMPSTMQT